VRADEHEDGGLGGAAVLGGVIEDWSVMLCRVDYVLLVLTLHRAASRCAIGADTEIGRATP
jgi:hypothetical protein